MGHQQRKQAKGVSEDTYEYFSCNFSFFKGGYISNYCYYYLSFVFMVLQSEKHERKNNWVGESYFSLVGC